MKNRMCKIKLEAKCYFVSKALQMASAVKRQILEDLGRQRVKSGHMDVTLTAFIAWQQNNDALTTQHSRTSKEAV